MNIPEEDVGNVSGEDVNKAIVAEGQALASGRSVRMPMAGILLVAGLCLLYFGLTTERQILMVFGAAFTVLSIFICFVIRQTERVITRIEEGIDRLSDRLEYGGDGKGPESKS